METVVYFVSNPGITAARSTEAALENAARHVSPLMARGVRVHVESNVTRLLAQLHARDVDALVIDARDEVGSIGESATASLMRTLFQEQDIGGPIGREQTWLVADAGDCGTRLSFEAGRARIAGVATVARDEAGWRTIWQRVESTLRRRKGGRIALCLAGGGIEGLFYELGVLRALQYFMPEFAVQDVDIVCGISAGAVIGAFMANGLSPDEIVRGMQFGQGRLDKIDPLTVFDPNLSELAQRVGASASSLLFRRASLLQSVFRLAPTGIFAGKGLRKYLAKQFAKPGMTDSFPLLKHKLFVGATDQDTAEHVVFGAGGWDHVPIHQAVRASSALTPFYAPERIDGRYFVDGAFTRTTNLRIAVENDATLVILIDPLVPICSDRPGYVASKGGVTVGMQGLKSLIHGRFDRAVHMLRTMYPHVAFHLFQPDGATMRVMAGSPTKFFHRTEIEEIAYRETIRAIRQHRFEGLQRDFGRHSVPFVDPQADLGTIKRDLLDEASEVQVA